MREQLERGLDRLRPGFQADGADLRLNGFDGQTAEVELVFGPNVCVECIIPHDFLKSMLEQALKQQVPSLQAVNLIDPRVTTGA